MGLLTSPWLVVSGSSRVDPFHVWANTRWWSLKFIQQQEEEMKGEGPSKAYVSRDRRCASRQPQDFSLMK